MTEPTDAIIAAIAPLVGHRLLGVEYGLLASDESRDITSPSMHLDGEVVLDFSEENPVHFTWSSWSGTKQDWVLRATPRSLWANSYRKIDASSLEPWPSLIGTQLVEGQVLGWLEEPTLVRLRFRAGSVLVGVGDCGRFGNADSVMVRPDHSPFLDFSDPIKVMWSSNHVA